jgi:hypothetical protein
MMFKRLTLTTVGLWTQYLDRVCSHRLRRRKDAWAYPGDLLRFNQSEHATESKNWCSLPPDELDRCWIAEFRRRQYF